MPPLQRPHFRTAGSGPGDLGYLDADRYLFIVGRIKEIIHKGGQKVAPAEVEGALLSHPAVIEAAVFPVPHERLGTDVAAAVVLRQDAKVSVQSLRDFARGRLAGFKVPGLIAIVPEIPKGPGGKVKRNELAAGFSKTGPIQDDGKGVAPSSELERQLAGIWKDILDIDRISVDQDVFALGVDSLAMTQLILRVEERFGIMLSFEDIFNSSTVAALALRLESSKGEAGSFARPHDPPLQISLADADGAQPISIVQERMLRIERKLPGLPQFNLPFAYRLQGRLSIPALEQSLAEVVRRHDLLRTAFIWQDEVPLARVLPDVDVRSILAVKDYAAPTHTGDTRAKELLLVKAKLEAERCSLAPIDMNNAPLFRAHIFRLDASDHVLLLVMHDIVIDGWSMAIFMEELLEIYAASISGAKAQLPKRSFQFSDFARWQRLWSSTEEANRQFAYWKRCLDKASPPFAAPKSSVGGELTSRVLQEPFQISNNLVTQLSAMSRDRGATLFMSLLAGFKTLLLLRSERNDICVATLMANRPQLRTERVIGPFANTTIIRTQLDAGLSFSEALKRVRRAVLEAYARQELPFDIIASRLAEETGLCPASLVQVYFVLQVAFRRAHQLPDLAVHPFGYQEDRSAMPIDRAWLSITLKDTPSGMTGICGRKDDLFEPNTVQNWVADYTAILVNAAANPDEQLGRLIDP
ncbi:condensation domain-containing protein [Bradyrhizobium sp. USDA 3364]